MQAVRQRQEQSIITQEQSLQAVKTMLSAGFSCIAWCRGVLPEDNFVDGPEGSGAYSQTNGSRSNVARLVTIKRGGSPAGDKLLDYLERGVFDALEKKYLKSFMFAIYLDAQDPNNIIECFTFSFKYHTVGGATVPVLSVLNNDMRKLSLGKPSRAQSGHQAVTKGKAPTLGEVKASVKALIRKLIMSMNLMDELPPQRFVTFKLFYTDDTPEDYEPPLFRPADVEKDHFYFATHTPLERPEKVSVGSFDTSYHGVSLNFASVCGELPRRNKSHDNLPYGEELPPSQALSSQQLLERKQKEAEDLKEDARQRRVVWGAEERAYTHESLRDGDGEPDPEFDGDAPDLSEEQPLGVRGEDGSIQPLPKSTATMESEDAAYAGSEENDSDFQNQYSLAYKSKSVIEATQRLRHLSKHGHQNNDTMLTTGLNTLDLNDMVMSNVETTVDEDMEDADATVDDSSIQGQSETLSSRILRPRDGRPAIVPVPAPRPRPANKDEKHCCCDTHVVSKKDIEESDMWCQCEGNCKKWYHVWCMGYESTRAFHERNPDVKYGGKPWACFECRFQQESLAALLSEEEKQEKMSQLQELAQFRFVLKLIIEPKALPDNPSTLRRKLGISSSVAIALWQRLEKDGFIVPVREDSNLPNRGNEPTAGKPKSKQRHRGTASVKFAVVRGAVAKVAKFFEGTHKMEEAITGLKELRRGARQEKKRKSHLDEESTTDHGRGPEIESQTQQDENVIPFPLSANARRSDKEVRTYSTRPKKKPKVSLAEEAIRSE